MDAHSPQDYPAQQETRDVSCIEVLENELDERIREMDSAIAGLIQRIAPVSRPANSVPCDDSAKEAVERNESPLARHLRSLIRRCSEMNCKVVEATDLLEV